jgi:hypothetical protein
MTNAEWVRRLANGHKETLTVAEYERLLQVVLELEAAEIDQAIVAAVIDARGVELTYAPAPEDGWPTFTARKGERVGYSHQFNGTNFARNALVGFSRATPAGQRAEGGGE